MVPSFIRKGKRYAWIAIFLTTSTHQDRMKIDPVEVQPFDPVQIAHLRDGWNESSVSTQTKVTRRIKNHYKMLLLVVFGHKPHRFVKFGYLRLQIGTLMGKESELADVARLVAPRIVVAQFSY